MAWLCLDCGNKSSKKFAAGRCPACDSFNIKGDSRSAKNVRARSDKRRKIDLLVLLLCWGGLAWLLFNKFL